MSWFKKNKPAEAESSENRKDGTISTDAKSDFDSIAAQVTAPGSTPVAAPGAQIESEEEKRFEIRPEWANATVRYMYRPLANRHHPAWNVTQEEADSVTPQMQAMLQAVCDRYAPEQFSRLAAKYPEFFDLAMALGVLTWKKWGQVRIAMREDAKKLKAETDLAAARAQGRHSAPISGEGPYFCLECGERCENQQALNDHMPVCEVLHPELKAEEVKPS